MNVTSSKGDLNSRIPRRINLVQLRFFSFPLNIYHVTSCVVDHKLTVLVNLTCLLTGKQRDSRTDLERCQNTLCRRYLRKRPYMCTCRKYALKTVELDLPHSSHNLNWAKGKIQHCRDSSTDSDCSKLKVFDHSQKKIESMHIFHVQMYVCRK